MKCEICHKAEAATVLHRKKEDGSDEELYVCKTCAAGGGKKGNKPASSKPPQEPKLKASGGEKPPKFVENFFKAALGLVEGIAETEKGRKNCPGCGRTWEQIKEERRVGCPRCYRTFAELIRGEFTIGAYGHVHVGDMPANVTGEDTRAYLERELKEAVKHQRFERAAQLRRKLDRLGDGNDKKGGKSAKERK